MQPSGPVRECARCSELRQEIEDDPREEISRDGREQAQRHSGEHVARKMNAQRDAGKPDEKRPTARIRPAPVEERQRAQHRQPDADDVDVVQRIGDDAGQTLELGGARVIARNDRYGSTVSDVSNSRADRQQIAYAYSLRNATVGWTPKLRVEFFSWFSRTRSWRGGASFTGFLANIRSESLAKVADSAERSALDTLSKPPPPNYAVNAVTPKGPGRNYTVKEALALLPTELKGRDFAQGKALFTATACPVCHRFNNEGSGIRPDISGAGSRYTLRDMLENIIEPSLVVSDQYASEQLDLTDGSSVVGRVVGEDGGDLLLMTNPFLPDDKTRVKAASVKSRKTYALSMMPPGLINALNVDELQDLLAYILSGGNPADARFKK